MAAIARPLGPKTLAAVRWQSGDDRPTVHKVDKKREEKIMEKKIEPTPETVSSTSTTIPATGAPGDEGSQDNEPQMMSGIMSDLVWQACTSLTVWNAGLTW